MTNKPLVKIALVSDNNFVFPSIVAICSVLEHCPTNQVQVHFLGDAVDAKLRLILDSVCIRYPNSELVYHDLTNALPAPEETVGHWPRAALARLRIPELIDGKVLYIDGDTYALSDVSELFGMALGNCTIAAVRDFGLLATLRKKTKKANELRSHATTILSPFAHHDYFNSGVMLIDCDQIRKNEELYKKFVDVNAVAKTPSIVYPDQDYLNWVLKGKVHFLNPSWNSQYGFSGRALRVAESTMPNSLIHETESPKILHFPGHRKPWHSFRVRDFRRMSFLRKFPRILEWKRNANRIINSLPADIPEEWRS